MSDPFVRLPRRVYTGGRSVVVDYADPTRVVSPVYQPALVDEPDDPPTGVYMPDRGTDGGVAVAGRGGRGSGLQHRPRPIPEISVEAVPDNFYRFVDQYPHRYFFHLVRGESESIIASIEAPLVQQVQVSPVAASKLTFTMNSYWDEHEGFRRRDIAIGGRSGYTPEHLEKFAQFRNFFEFAERQLAIHKNAFSRGEDIRLVVDFPWEGESFYCNIVEGGGLRWVRDRSVVSLSYVWALSAQTYGVAVARDVLALNREKIAPFLGPDTVHTGARHPCHRAARRAEDKAQPGEPNSLGNLPRTCRRIEEGSTGAGRGSADAGGSIATGTENIDLGTEYSQLMGEATDQWIAKRTAYDQMDVAEMDIIRERVIPIMGWMSNVMMEAALWHGLSRRITPRWLLNYVTGGRSEELYAAAQNLYSSFEFAYWQLFGSRRRASSTPTADPSSGERVVSATVTSADRTVFDLAYRETGDRLAAWPIIELNGLRDARTWANGQPIAPGDRLIVPKPDGLPKSQFTDLLGTDWKVVKGDFVLDPSGGDFVRVNGEDCYMQNTVHRLKTLRGTNRAFPRAGLADHIGDGTADLNPAAVAADVQRQVQMDYRTDRILRVDVKDPDPLVLEVDLAVETISKSRSLLSYTYSGK